MKNALVRSTTEKEILDEIKIITKTSASTKQWN